MDDKLHEKVLENIIKKKSTRPLNEPILPIGTRVRLALIKDKIEKKNNRNFTDEIFTIYKVLNKSGIKPVRYRVQDQKEKIKGVICIGEIL